MEGEKTETAPRPDKDAQRGVRGSSTADAWRPAGVQTPTPVWRHSTEHSEEQCPGSMNLT